MLEVGGGGAPRAPPSCASGVNKTFGNIYVRVVEVEYIFLMVYNFQLTSLKLQIILIILVFRVNNNLHDQSYLMTTVSRT